MKAVPVCLCQCFNTLKHQLNLGMCACSHSLTCRKACWCLLCQLGLPRPFQLQLRRDASCFTLHLVTEGTCIPYIKPQFYPPTEVLCFTRCWMRALSVVKVSFCQTGLEEFLGLYFHLGADDTDNLCMKVLFSLFQLVPRGHQWERTVCGICTRLQRALHIR